MSPELACEEYTEQWFRERFGYRSPYHRFTEAILEVLRPEAVADVGCGMAWTVEYLRTRLPCIGVESARAALRLMRPDVRALVHLHDIACEPPIPQMGDYELCISIEVAEHIPPAATDRFLDWCTCGRRLLMTAAPPGQRGLRHVNCRRPEWWHERLAQRGWVYEPALSAGWREAARRRTGACPWVVRNAMIFTRGADARETPL